MKAPSIVRHSFLRYTLRYTLSVVLRGFYTKLGYSIYKLRVSYDYSRQSTGKIQEQEIWRVNHRDPLYSYRPSGPPTLKGACAHPDSKGALPYPPK